MPIKINVSALAGVKAGSSNVSKVMVGSTQIWPSFTSMGMYLTVTDRYDDGNYQWVQVTNMAAMTAYPGSVLSSNRLVLSGSAIVRVSATITYSGASNNQVGIYVNGSRVAATTGSGSPRTITYDYTASNGDLVALYTNPENAGAWSRTLQSGQTNTFLTVTPL